MSISIGQVSIRSNSGPEALVQLLDWFRHDDALRGRVQPLSPQIRDGQMGDIFDVLVVAVGSGGAITVLVQSLRTWFSTRRSDVSFTLTRSDGAEVQLDAKRVDSAEVLAALERLFGLSDSSL